MLVRVVCGLCVTMASFCPSRAFNSVDLPALGRPIIETKPERKGIPHYALCGLCIGIERPGLYGISGVLRIFIAAACI